MAGATRKFLGRVKDRRRGCKQWRKPYRPRAGSVIEAPGTGPDEPLSPEAKRRRDEARVLLRLRAHLTAVETRQKAGGLLGKGQTPIAPYSAPWWRELGLPPRCGPGDHSIARAYAANVERVLDREWPYRMRANMQRVLRDWRARAEGLDPVFEVAGFDPNGRYRYQTARLNAKRKRAVLQARARGSMPEV